MKKYLLLLSIFIISLSACNKGDIVSTQATIDDAKIQAYIKANNLTMTKDPSGVYYQIIKPGTGSYPVSTSNVKVTYTFTYLNGTIVQSAASVPLLLGSTVAGFQTGVEHINVGGRILFIIPSGLAYGPSSSSGVDANAVLVYTVDLLGFY